MGVHQDAEPAQSVVRGAAFLGAMATGLLRLEDLPSLVAVGREIVPDPAVRRLHDDGYAHFVKLYGNNRAFHHALNGNKAHLPAKPA